MRDVAGFEGLYKVTSCGKIWSVRYNRFIKPAGGKGNYQMICLQVKGKQYFDYVHRIMAKAYIPNPDNCKEVNHKDEVKDHNWVNNLEWCDRRYNINYGTRNDLVREKNRLSGCYKHIPKRIYCVETDTVYPSINSAAKELNLSQPLVSNCVNGKCKSVKGYHFRYSN